MKETIFLTAISLAITIAAVIIAYYAYVGQSWILLGAFITGVGVGLLAAFVIAVTHNDRYL